MTVGDTLLKLSDFPFAYSLLAIIFFSVGTDIVKDQYLFLTLSGFFATTLAIIDPGSRYVKSGRRKKITNSNRAEETKRYEISALDTRSINLEIEKIVSFIYFVFILLAFTLATMFSSSFVSRMVIMNADKITICDKVCVQGFGLTIPTIIALLLIWVAKEKMIKLSQSIEIAGFYRHVMDLKSVTLQSKENLSRAIDQNDWELATWWKTQLEKEIEVEAGLEEQRTKLRIETLEKQLVAYGELLTILTMAKMVGSDNNICLQAGKPYLFSIPEDEDRLRQTFAKSRYLFTAQLSDYYSEYEKKKQFFQSTRAATNESHTFSMADLDKMEKVAQSEYDKAKNAYEEITDLEI